MTDRASSRPSASAAVSLRPWIGLDELLLRGGCGGANYSWHWECVCGQGGWPAKVVPGLRLVWVVVRVVCVVRHAEETALGKPRGGDFSVALL